MAEHSGIFDWLRVKVGAFIQSRSFIAYWTSDGSDVMIGALPNDNSLVTKGMLNTAISGVAPNQNLPLEIPFTDSLTINWQTDFIPGSSTITYDAYYGDTLPKIAIYSGNYTDGYDYNMPNVHIIRPSILIETVVFNMPGSWVIVI